MMKSETSENYRAAYILMCPDSVAAVDAADAVVEEAKKRFKENSTCTLFADMMPEYTEDDAIRDTLRAAILDVYFGSMTQATAAVLRGALGEYGTVCIDPRCSDLTFRGWEVAKNYNDRHPGSEIDTHCTGYVPFEI